MSTLRNEVRDYFRAVSQAFFFEDPYFGAALMAVLLFFSRGHFLCAFSASVICHLYAVRYSTPKLLKTWGLITINGLFFGLAMASLFDRTPGFYLCLAIGALVIPMLTKAFFEVLQHWKLSPYIMPYIAMVWILMLASHGSAAELHAASVTLATHAAWPLELRTVWAILESAGRLLFIPDASFGLAVVCLVLAFSPRRGLFFLIGTAAATVAAAALSPRTGMWENGFFSYCGGLVGLGLASFLEKFRWQTILLFCVLSTFLTMAMVQLVQGLQLPALSLPYVLTLWIAVLSRVPRVSVSWAPSPQPVRRLS